MLLAPATRPTSLARLHGHRQPRACCCSATSTPSSRTPSTGRSRRDGEQLVGSGTVDMKGGVVLALGALRALAQRPQDLRRGRAAAGLRRGVAHGAVRPRRALRRLRRLPVLRGAASCTPDGEEASSCAARPRARSASTRTGARRTRARRPTAAATRCSRSPPPPRPSPPATTRDGPAHLTAVPTVLRSGDAFNVVPGARRAVLRPARRRPRRDRGACSTRSRREVERRRARRRADPPLAGHALRGGDRAAARARDARRSGRPVARRRRAAAPATPATSPRTIPLTVDGLGPRGGEAHNPEEFVLEASLQPRAEVALAVIDAALSA